MQDVNTVVMTGRLTRDPELRYLPSGTPKGELRLAVNREWTKDGDKQKEVCYIDVVLWKGLAEVVARYMKKGSRVLVQGRLAYVSWAEETIDGRRRSKHELVAETVQFLDSPPEPKTED